MWGFCRVNCGDFRVVGAFGSNVCIPLERASLFFCLVCVRVGQRFQSAGSVHSRHS